MDSYPEEEITLGGPIYRLYEDGKPFKGELKMGFCLPEPKVENCHAAWTVNFGDRTAVMTFELHCPGNPWTDKDPELPDRIDWPLPTFIGPNGREIYHKPMEIIEDFEDA